VESALGTRTKLRGAVVYNPTKVDLPALKQAVDEAAHEAGWEPPLWLPTTEDDPGNGRTREALKQNATVVLAAGGDGTVRAVSESLHNTGVPLAIVPTGTGNLLARNLSLDLTRVKKSVSAAFTGRTRAIDVGVATLTHATGEITERVFVVMAGLGLDAHMIANTKPTLKNRVGWLAYFDSGVKSIWSHTPVTIRFTLDGASERTARVSTILVGNCGRLPGNIRLLPGAAIDDGFLDIAAIQPRSAVGWVQVCHSVAWKNFFLRHRAMNHSRTNRTDSPRIRAMSYLRGKSIQISVDPPEQIQFDGDAGGLVRSVSITVDPGSLLVKVPA